MQRGPTCSAKATGTHPQTHAHLEAKSKLHTLPETIETGVNNPPPHPNHTHTQCAFTTNTHPHTPPPEAIVNILPVCLKFSRLFDLTAPKLPVSSVEEHILFIYKSKAKDTKNNNFYKQKKGFFNKLRPQAITCTQHVICLCTVDLNPYRQMDTHISKLSQTPHPDSTLFCFHPSWHQVGIYRF